VPGGLPYIGGLLGVGFVLQPQVLDARDTEALERHGILLLPSLEIEIFSWKEEGQGMKASLCLSWEGGPKAQAET